MRSTLPSPLISPTIHLGGTHPDVLRAELEAVQNAAHALRQALLALTLHRRDFLIGDFAEANYADSCETFSRALDDTRRIEDETREARHRILTQMGI